MSEGFVFDPVDAVGNEDVFQHAPCGYLILDRDGTISRANAVVEQWTGQASSELVGKRLPDLIRAAGRILHETHFAPLLKLQGFVKEIAFDLKASDGRAIQVLVNAVERKDVHGEVVGTYVVMFPAAERRRYERALVDAQDALEAGLRSATETGALRDQFIAILGHDLRNPLASIASASRMLAKEPVSDRARRVLDLMDGSVSRMAALIDDVLDFARSSLGSGIGIKVQIEGALSVLIQQVVDELRAGNPNRSLEAEIDVSGVVECDSGRLGQLVSNLLGNALTHGATDQPVRLVATTRAGVLEISVSNGGTAISPSAMDRLFQPFFRGDSGEKSLGLGLGLHIASEIAKAHGGKLSVTSDETETRFTFRMSLLRDGGPQGA